jgi:hypothetical protein
MVGVYDEPLEKDLGSNRKMVLCSDWEGDASLLQGHKNMERTLPGPGGTWYWISVIEDDDRGGLDESKALQKFTFRGGGYLQTGEVPPTVKAAFDRWYRKLAPKSESP